MCSRPPASGTDGQHDRFCLRSLSIGLLTPAPLAVTRSTAVILLGTANAQNDYKDPSPLAAAAAPRL